MSGLALKTRWILALDEQSKLCALENKFLVIEDGYIKSISDGSDLSKNTKIIDYGFSLAMPGLVNLHCHLDYSRISYTDFEFDFALNNSDLFKWIPVLIAKTSKWSQSDYFDSALYGASQALLSGTTFIVDNSYLAQTGVQALSSFGLKGVVGLELFGIDETQAESQFASWLERFHKIKCNDKIELTASPHAPYTVSPALWKRARQFARSRNTRLLAHIAESKTEFDWFKNTNGQEKSDLDQFLLSAFSSFRNQDGELEQVKNLIQNLPHRGCGLSPLEHLNKHGLLDENLLAAHCVWLEDKDIDMLKQNSSALALCPLSNSLLSNGRAPLEKFLAKNIKLGFGTDSLASSYSLDLRQTARFAIQSLRQEAPEFEIDKAKIVSLLTFDAAKTLGKEDKIGSLAPGKCADILILKLPSDWNKVTGTGIFSPFDMALSAQACVEDVFVDGKMVVSKGKPVTLSGS